MGDVLVTGACGGIGRAFCEQLIKTDDLFIIGRSAQRLRLLKEDLLKIRNSAKIEYYEVDIAHVSQREKLFEYVDNNEIRFSGLINVAGADIQKEFITKRNNHNSSIYSHYNSQMNSQLLSQINNQMTIQNNCCTLNYGNELKSFQFDSIFGIEERQNVLFDSMKLMIESCLEENDD